VALGKLKNISYN